MVVRPVQMQLHAPVSLLIMLQLILLITYAVFQTALFVLIVHHAKFVKQSLT